MNVNLKWAPNAEQDLAGYNVYVGTQSGVYGVTPIEVVSSFAVLNLPDGIAHYFAVTARDNVGNESGFSTEVSKINRFVRITA